MAYLHHGWTSESGVFIVAEGYTPSLLSWSIYYNVGSCHVYMGNRQMIKCAPIPRYTVSQSHLCNQQVYCREATGVWLKHITYTVNHKNKKPII